MVRTTIAILCTPTALAILGCALALGVDVVGGYISWWFRIWLPRRAAFSHLEDLVFIVGEWNPSNLVPEVGDRRERIEVRKTDNVIKNRIDHQECRPVEYAAGPDTMKRFESPLCEAIMQGMSFLVRRNGESTVALCLALFGQGTGFQSMALSRVRLEVCKDDSRLLIRGCCSLGTNLKV